MPYANTEAMNKHLEEISKAVRRARRSRLRRRRLHGSEELVVQDNITAITLPAYSPELNPAENVWESFRKNKLANRLYETYEDIVDACCNAWNTFMAAPESVATLTQRAWAKVS
jgi:transposase